MPYLINIHDKNEESISLRIKKKTLVGRETVCDLRYDDALMSREHFYIIHDKQKELYKIEDNDSANGTFLNGIKLEPYSGVTLKNGDQIKAGYQLFLFLNDKPCKHTVICSECAHTINTYLPEKELICPVCDGKVSLD